MQAKKTMLSLAVVGAIAAAGAAFAYGPGPQGGGIGMMGPRSGAPMDPALHAERVQARLDALKDALKLQAGQVDAWNAYEARVKSGAEARAQLRQEMQAHRGDPEAMADYRVTMMKHNAQAAEEINGLRKAFVATLTAEQQATFNEYSMSPRFARGPGAGPGFGPGAGGGRGPGYGRGCLGAV
jgi:Spy/CpxP family protein refolding chaperone